jgi:hypothetical protein
MAAIINLCDCSSNGLPFYRPCVPAPGAGCVWNYDNSGCHGFSHDPTSTNPISTVGGCSSLDYIATLRRIQNQSRASESQYIDTLDAVVVANNTINFGGDPKQLENMRSSVWGDPNNLRNQSDRSTPSRSGAFSGGNLYTPQSGTRAPAFGVSVGKPGYVNVPTRGNSTKSTITANKPGAMTPGGQGVDVKHGSYHRYLAKKKGKLLTVRPAGVYGPPSVLIPLRQNPNGFNDPATNNQTFDSAGVNNMIYKFSLVSFTASPNCFTCKPGEYWLPTPN